MLIVVSLPDEHTNSTKSRNNHIGRMSTALKLTFEVTQDDKFQFFQRYDKLGTMGGIRSGREFAGTPSTSPTDTTASRYIAPQQDCSRKHVNRTFALFKQWGWIWLQSTEQRKIIHIDPTCLLIDVKEREYFMKLRGYIKGYRRGSGFFFSS